MRDEMDEAAWRNANGVAHRDPKRKRWTELDVQKERGTVPEKAASSEPYVEPHPTPAEIRGNCAMDSVYAMRYRGDSVRDH